MYLKRISIRNFTFYFAVKGIERERALSETRKFQTEGRSPTYEAGKPRKSKNRNSKQISAASVTRKHGCPDNRGCSFGNLRHDTGQVHALKLQKGKDLASCRDSTVLYIYYSYFIIIIYCNINKILVHTQHESVCYFLVALMESFIVCSFYTIFFIFSVENWQWKFVRT